MGARTLPGRRDYLDVYDHYGQLGPRAIYGHGIHLGENEWARLAESGSAIAHCPTSNMFLGSGLFDLSKAKKRARPVRVGLATDVGAGTSLSMLKTLGAAYQTAQLNGIGLSAMEAFYLRDARRGAGAVSRGSHRQSRRRHGSGPHRAQPRNPRR